MFIPKVHLSFITGFYQYIFLQANEEIIDPKCQVKTICKPGGKLVYKKLEPCQPNGICKILNYIRACVCKKGFYYYNGRCVPAGI